MKGIYGVFGEYKEEGFVIFFFFWLLILILTYIYQGQWSKSSQCEKKITVLFNGLGGNEVGHNGRTFLATPGTANETSNPLSVNKA